MRALCEYTLCLNKVPTFKPGLAALNPADFNHWLKSLLNQMIFLSKKSCDLNDSCLFTNSLSGLNRQYWTQGHALFEVVPVFISFIHWVWVWEHLTHSLSTTTTTTVTALFPGPPGWAGARRELLDFMVQGKINRGRHMDHPGGRHSILTNQCPPLPSPHFLQAGCPSCCPTNSVKALKATSAFGLGRRH